MQIHETMQESLNFIEKWCSSFFLKIYFPACLWVVFFVTALLCVADCHAANVTFAWDASPDPVTGYTVFYGEQSVLANPSTPKSVGNVLQCTIVGLLPGHTYYFAVKASYYNNESGFSNEVTYTVLDDGEKCPFVNLLGENNPDLENIRSFRDKTLAENAIGRKIISIYYNNADSINAALENSPPLRAFTRKVLETIASMMEKNYN